MGTVLVCTGTSSIVDSAHNMIECSPWWTSPRSVHQCTCFSSIISEWFLTRVQMRNIYEIRERPSRMYNWSALTTSQLLCEIPWNMIGASLFFCCWYWTVGFATSRAGFTYFVYGVQFPLYWTTIALTVASASPTAEIAGLLYSFMFTFVLTL